MVSCNWAGRTDMEIKSNVKCISSKLMNMRIRAIDRNRSNNSIMKVLHWNVGLRLWENKLLKIESLLVEK